MARSTARADPQWPSLEGQLSALGTRQGSALEPLVKDKIRTSGLLRPEEANDDLGLPLWLRVHVRKADYDERRAVARLLVSKSDDAHSSDSIQQPAGSAPGSPALGIPSAGIWRQPASTHG